MIKTSAMGLEKTTTGVSMLHHLSLSLLASWQFTQEFSFTNTFDQCFPFPVARSSLPVARCPLPVPYFPFPFPGYSN